MNRFRASSNFDLARPGERGVTMILIAVAMIFMVLAIAAIAIDVGAMYTARAEAKHAADAAALAGAKVLANSGMTSETGATSATLQTNAKALATLIATSVATQNEVGERNLVFSEVTVSFSSGPSFVITPQVTVTVRRTDFPTFFARAWGRSTVAVGATSTAEAVNPSNSSTITGGNSVLIAPSCVKPWIIPNEDPNHPGSKFFNPSGAIVSNGMVGQPLILLPACPPVGCTAADPPPTPPAPAPVAGAYYSAAFTTPPPNQEPAGCFLSCDYAENIAACSPQPITCGALANAAVDVSKSCSGDYNGTTDGATSCLIHSLAGQDTITVGAGPPITNPPRFVAQAGNPLVDAGSVSTGNPISTSDSIVTIPVYDPTPGTHPNVNVIGFIQGFITGAGPTDGYLTGQVAIKIMNLSGCGAPSGAPVVGDGISPVPVHLITPP